jgi:hypothetical protein
MTITPSPSRRGFLRGCLRGAGALAALPFLESLSAPLWAGDADAARTGAARADGPPLRQVIVTVAGGTVIESWKPKAPGPLGKLPSILRPLQPFAADLLIVSGLSHNGRQEGGGNGHTNCAGLHLTGTPVIKWEGKVPRCTISVDQAAAAAVGGETILPSLELGDSNGEHMFSWTAAGERVPYEGGPRQAFDRLFKGRTPSLPAWKHGKGGSTAAKPNAAKPDARAHPTTSWSSTWCSRTPRRCVAVSRAATSAGSTSTSTACTPWRTASCASIAAPATKPPTAARRCRAAVCWACPQRTRRCGTRAGATAIPSSAPSTSASCPTWRCSRSPPTPPGW